MIGCRDIKWKTSFPQILMRGSIVVALLQLPVDRLIISGGIVVASRVHEEVVFRVFKHRLDLPTGQSSLAFASRRWDAHSNFRLPLGERVRDILEKDQAEDGMLVNRGVEIRAELVGGGLEFFVELAGEGLGRGVGHLFLTPEAIYLSLIENKITWD